ncbi:MAG: nucleotide sugar dehydrogenase [Cyclobacteriaceae bacterium]|nr:nucleotide sugar dehydrogenase [Cyclobacteriaceae bacterium]
MKNLDKILTQPNVTLSQLLVQMDEAPRHNVPGGILLITDEQGFLLGTITDGDIRRALIKNKSLDLQASEIMVTNPIVFPDDFTIQQILERLATELEKRKRRSNRFLSKIILVDETHKPTRILDYHQLWEQRVATHRHLCVVGLGYVGLTLALVLADEGYLVTGVDTNMHRIKSLENSESYIHEVGLQELLREQMGKNFRVSTILPESCDVFIISVGTPIETDASGNKVPSLKYLTEAVDTIANQLKPGNLVILRSTVPVGTCRDFVKKRLEEKTQLVCGLDFHLSFAPERTAEGKALKELRSLPQIIGGYNVDSLEATAAIFREVTPTLVKVDSLEEAEMAKLINNSFRDYIFGYANQVARIASHFNINIVDVIRAANEGYPRDPVPLPSPGVGGPCLTKDPYIFAHVAESASLDGSIFRNGRNINISMHTHVVDGLAAQLASLNKNVSTSKILVCGLSFKGNPETGDLRDSTSVEIAQLLQRITPHVYGYDAIASADDIRALKLKPVSLPEGFSGMDAVLFLNNHKSFERLDVFEMVRAMNERPVVYDAWDLFREEDVLHVKPAVYMGLSFVKSSITG